MARLKEHLHKLRQIGVEHHVLVRGTCHVVTDPASVKGAVDILVGATKQRVLGGGVVQLSARPLHFRVASVDGHLLASPQLATHTTQCLLCNQRRGDKGIDKVVVACGVRLLHSLGSLGTLHLDAGLLDEVKGALAPTLNFHTTGFQLLHLAQSLFGLVDTLMRPGNEQRVRPPHGLHGCWHALAELALHKVREVRCGRALCCLLSLDQLVGGFNNSSCGFVTGLLPLHVDLHQPRRVIQQLQHALLGGLLLALGHRRPDASALPSHIGTRNDRVVAVLVAVDANE